MAAVERDSPSDKARESRKEDRRTRARSPSQSPATIQRFESYIQTAEDKEKWRAAASKWINDIEPGFFQKVEKQFDASANGCGAESGIELDMSGSTDEEGHVETSRSQIHAPVPADPNAVAVEFWQEVSAKATVAASRTAANAIQEPLARAISTGDRSASNSPASGLGRNDYQHPQILRNPQFSHNGRSEQPESPLARSPGILPYKPPQVRQPPNNQRPPTVQTGYMRDTRAPDNYTRYEPNDRRDNMQRHRGDNNRGRFQPIHLGPYQDLFAESLPNNLKFIDSHAHWCFTMKKLQNQGIESHRDLKNAFPEMFPSSYGGSIQVFCLPLYLRSFDHWYRKLIEGTEGELWFTYGCHPNFVDDWNDDIKQGMLFSMDRMKERDRLVGLGEIGLDYNRQNNNEEKKERQREIFKVQLDIAVQQRLPIVIHCRNDESYSGSNQAELDCFEIMKQRVPHDWPIHRHCFRGSPDEAQKWIDYYPKVMFGFTPCISGTKDNLARESVRVLPLDRILLETDAPYYTPAQMSNFPMENTADKQPRKVAIPGGIALVTALEVSRLKNIPLETVVKQTRDNTLHLYDIRDYDF